MLKLIITFFEHGAYQFLVAGFSSVTMLEEVVHLNPSGLTQKTPGKETENRPRKQKQLTAAPLLCWDESAYVSGC